jgi:hypothetical protein
MIFQSFNKGLRLVVDAGRKEVDKSTGTPVLVIHPNREIHFKMWRYDTSTNQTKLGEEAENEFLMKKCSRFSTVPGLPDTLWVFIPPRDYAAEIKAKDARIAELEARVAAPAVNAAAPTESKSAKAPKCDSCDTKDTFHRKGCPKNPKTVKAENPLAG